MKNKLLAGLILLTSFSFGQIPVLKTSKYGGVYSNGDDIEKGRVGTVTIYPETDSTVLFYFDLNRGAPSYNMGTLYGRIKVVNGEGIFHMKLLHQSGHCGLTFQFKNDLLKVDEPDGLNHCGFGHAVFAGGVYTKNNAPLQPYFTDMEGTRFYFKDTSPEEFYKNE